MGEKVMRFSDLSGLMAENPEDLASIIVTEHPDLEAPVQIEAMPEELGSLGKLAIQAVGLEVTRAGAEEPSRYVLTVSNFNKLATHRPMDEVLADAQPVAKSKQRRSHNTTVTGEPLINYSTLEQAGVPHKGKISPEEARLVRENLEGVNKRLAAQGIRTIDPTNPEHAKRYSFDTAAPADA